jgi:Tfp pilus assembly protein PilF
MSEGDGPPGAAAPADNPLLQQIGNALRAGDVASAKVAAREALAGGLEHPLLLNLRALGYEDAGEFEKALVDLRRAHILSPKDFAILNACGLCLARLERYEEALQCYEQALSLRPEYSQAWFNRAYVLERLGETAKAAESYAKTVGLMPEHAMAWAAMAALAARRGDKVKTRQYAEQALALEPSQGTAVLAMVEIEMSDPPVAEKRVREFLARGEFGEFDHALALGHLGDILNAEGRIAEAFEAYTESNNLFLKEAKPRFEAPGQTTVANAVTWMLRWAKAQSPKVASAATSSYRSTEPRHVFLIGFPRSGTTLVESMLTGHPDVVSLEERSTLQASVRAWLTDSAAISRLMRASDAELKPYRDDYWARVKGYGCDPAGKIFIDKNPFNTLKLPLIQRLFPDAKVIFALRDPRDVVLSGFRRRFNLNPSTYELLDLGRAASLYAAMMSFAEAFRAAFPFEEHRIVYERFVADFVAESKALCAFIGADWRDELLQFADRAKRGDVASASSAQIARGLYSDGAGQWRRYRDQLAPVLPLLAPWVERFGYPSD